MFAKLLHDAPHVVRLLAMDVEAVQEVHGVPEGWQEVQEGQELKDVQEVQEVHGMPEGWKEMLEVQEVHGIPEGWQEALEWAYQQNVSDRGGSTGVGLESD